MFNAMNIVFQEANIARNGEHQDRMESIDLFNKFS